MKIFTSVSCRFLYMHSSHAVEADIVFSSVCRFARLLESEMLKVNSVGKWNWARE